VRVCQIINACRTARRQAQASGQGDPPGSGPDQKEKRTKGNGGLKAP
jgi:hypothetical protein